MTGLSGGIVFYTVFIHYLTQFLCVLDNFSNMRNTRVLSVRVALAVFLAKLRLGLSNSVIAPLF